MMRQSSKKTKYRATRMGTRTDSTWTSSRQTIVKAIVPLRVKSSLCRGVSLRQLKGIACWVGPRQNQQN